MMLPYNVLNKKNVSIRPTRLHYAILIVNDRNCKIILIYIVSVLFGVLILGVFLF